MPLHFLCGKSTTCMEVRPGQSPLSLVSGSTFVRCESQAQKSLGKFFSTEGGQVLTRSVSLSCSPRDLFTGPRKRSGCLGLVGTVGS